MESERNEYFNEIVASASDKEDICIGFPGNPETYGK